MFGFFVFVCLFLLVVAQEGKIFPPQNLSLHWSTDFHPKLTWEPPQHQVKNCTYRYNLSIQSDKDNVSELSWTDYIVMEGGALKIAVQTQCNDRESEWVSISSDYPDLVNNVTCFIHTPTHTHCSWVPVTPAPDLRFFYRLAGDPVQDKLLECSSYENDTSGVRTGCSLKADPTNHVVMVFNATLNQTLARNTFSRNLLDYVRPPPLELNVTKGTDELQLSWNPPALLRVSLWNFEINYTECGKARDVKQISETTLTTLPRVSHCQYQINVRATTRGGETPWSKIETVEADPDGIMWVYVVLVVIPLIFAVLAALFLMFCRKNKEILFPKIPQPKDFISDISDNNNKSPVCDLFVPEEEEECCKVTLVMDPQMEKLEC